MSESAYDAQDLLSRAQQIQTVLRSSTDLTVDADKFPALFELLSILNDSGPAARPELAAKLDMNISWLDEFFADRPIAKNHADIIADKVVTYLMKKLYRSKRPGTANQQLRKQALARENNDVSGHEDHDDTSTAFNANVVPPTAPHPSDVGNEEHLPSASFTIKATEWKYIIRTPEIEGVIEELIPLLREVMDRATTTNLPTQDRAMSASERAQLIAILETAIQVLQAPMLEKSLLKKAKDAMEKGALSAIEKGVENTFSFLAGIAVGKLSDFIGHI